MTLLATAPFDCSQAAAFEAQAVIGLVNQARENRGIPQLKVDRQLSKAAQSKAEDMIKHNYFAHISPSGVTPWQWIGQSGYDYSFAGENLAINFTDPESQHQAFMNSEGHRKNILNENYQEIGVAVIKGKIDNRQTIVTVQEFGAKTDETPARKAVAGITAGRSPTTTPQKKNLPANRFADIFAKASPVPLLAFLTAFSTLIVLTVFFYELFSTHFQTTLRLLFLRAKIKLLRFQNSLFNLFSFRAGDRPSPHREKLYLAHMKLKR